MTDAIATHVEPGTADPQPLAPTPDPSEPAAPEPTAVSPKPAEPAPEPEPTAVEPASPAPERWREALGEDLGKHPALEAYKPEDFVSVPRHLVRSYIEEQRFLGAEKTPVPQENWTEEDWAAHYNRLGRPESPEGYAFEAPELPEDYPYSEETDGMLAAELHKLGLNKEQAARARSLYYEIGVDTFKAAQEQAAKRAEENDQTIRTEWGGAYPAKLQLANEAFHEYGGTPEEIDAIRLMKLADGTELGAHPLFLKTFSRIGETLKEHDILKGDVHTRDFGMSKEQAAAEYAKLENRFFDMAKTDPEYNAVNERMKQLAPIAFGGGGR